MSSSNGQHMPLDHEGKRHRQENMEAYARLYEYIYEQRHHLDRIHRDGPTMPGDDFLVRRLADLAIWELRRQSLMLKLFDPSV